MLNTISLFETERLIIREFSFQDLEYIHEYAQNPKVVEYQNWGPNTLEDTENFLKRCIDWIDRKPRLVYEFCIVSKELNTPIGGCGVFVQKDNAKAAQVGYVLNPKYWNKGYMTEVVNSLVNYAKREIGIEVLKATCDSRNWASKRVLEKSGFVVESMIENHLEIRGQMRDSLVFNHPDNQPKLTVKL